MTDSKPLVEKGKDGKLKRIEFKHKYLRASRTGGVSLRAQTKLGKVNTTYNTSHGLRLSLPTWKGFRLFSQDGKIRFQGRHKVGKNVSVNTSKSGFSLGVKNQFGSWNSHGRSSFKFGGVQVRGKKAHTLQNAYVGFLIFDWLFDVALALLTYVGQVIKWIWLSIVWPSIMWIFEFIWLQFKAFKKKRRFAYLKKKYRGKE